MAPPIVRKWHFLCFGDSPASFTFSTSSLRQLEMVLFLQVSGSSKRGMFMWSQ